MKYKLFILSLLLLFVFTTVHSQKLSGEAIYQTQSHIDIKLDSSSVNSEMQKSIQEQLRKQFQKEYVLTFNNIESLWKEVPTLGKPQAPSSSGILVQVQVSGNNDELYHNVKEERYVNQSNLFSKIFLVADTLKKPEWKLEKEIKNIGQYKCFKATLTQEYTASSFTTGDKESQVEKKTKVTTAWYTLDIPVPVSYTHLTLPTTPYV